MLNGHTAVITGASSGIGEAMARLLAEWGASLVVTARRRDRLDALAAALRAHYRTEVRVLVEDLGDPAGPGRLWKQVTSEVERIDVWINNAGFGTYQQFWETPLPRVLDMLQLNVTSLVELSHRFVHHALESDRRAYLLNVSSMVAYMAAAYYANYGATKAYVRNFSESLAAELAGTNVSVTCVCPGATESEFIEVAGLTISRGQRKLLMSAERCARISLRAMLRGRRNVVTGWTNAMACWMMRFAPRRTVTFVSRRVLGPPVPASATLPDAGHREETT
jgi:short-subunit dehydrogenase